MTLPTGEGPKLTYDPAGSDEEHPAACTICDADAVRTDQPRPSGYGWKVRCVNGHISNGMPRYNYGRPKPGKEKR